MKLNPRSRSTARVAITASVTATALATVGLLPAVAHTPVWDKGTSHTTGENYVALGDSFVSGPGIAPIRPGNSCDRSEKNFPTVVAAQLDVATFTDASCSGAVTADLTNAQNRSGRTNEPQLDAVTADTTLVTFGTIGGNDIGLVGLASACAGEGSCVPAVGTDPLAGRFTQVRTDLVAGIEAVKTRAPQADVVVLGYGVYLPAAGCPEVFGGLVSVEESAYLQGQVDRLSDLLADVAAETGVAFADQRDIPGVTDHTVCAAPADQWIRGLYFGTDGSIFHPSSAGMAATAAHVTSLVHELRGTTPVTPEPEPTEPTKPPTTPGPTHADRKAVLNAKANAVRAAITCTGPQRNRTVTVKVTSRASGHVTRHGGVGKVVVKAGGRTLATDRKAPFTVKLKASKVKKHLKKSSRVRVVVTVRAAGISTARTITLKRPGCLR